MNKSKKWITGIMLLLILTVSLFVPVAAYELSDSPDSVTLHLSSVDDTSYKNVPLPIPDGYSFSDLSSISGVYYVVPTDGSDPYSVQFSQVTYAFQTSLSALANVHDCEFISPFSRAFTITFPSGSYDDYFCVNIASSAYEGCGIVELTFHFGDNDEAGGSFSVFHSVYDIIHHYIYGGVEMNADMSLTCTLLATIASVFVFAVPFVLVWGFFKRWL